MDKINYTLNNWLDELNNKEFPDYGNLPEFDLYMKQLIPYLEREFKVFENSSLDKTITSSMINNYVKSEVITAPINKTYNKEHLVQILEACSLKKVLSLDEIKQILDIEFKDVNKSISYTDFKDATSTEIKEAVAITKSELKDISDNDVDSLTNLALKMAIKANAYITIAKKILFLNNIYTEMKSNKQETEQGPIQQSLDL